MTPSRVSPPLQREPVEIEPRAMTPARRARILAAHNGCCAYPGCTETQALEVDHIVALGLGGKDREDNLEPLCPVHHLQKTKRDVALIAKCKRNFAKHTGSFPPSKAKLQSRGFAPTRDWGR